MLKEHGTSELNTGTKMAELLKRTELNYDILEKIDPDRPKLDKQEKEEVICYLNGRAMTKSKLEKTFPKKKKNKSKRKYIKKKKTKE